MTKDFISLNEIAKITNVNKSKLRYYTNLGLLSPEITVGKMQIFKYKETIEILRKIKKLRKSGYNLKQIKSELSWNYENNNRIK